MTSSNATAVLSGDVNEELADLESRLNKGIAAKVEPIVRNAQDAILERADNLLDQFQLRPLTTLAFTALLAFVIGRLSR